MPDSNASRMLLPRRFIRQCRKKLLETKISDSTGAKLSGGSLLMRTLIARRILRREVLGADERTVGILLPPSVGAVVVNAAVTLDGRVAANLNYTLSSAVLNECIGQAGLRRVLTSRRVLDKMDLKIESDLVLLEDLRDKATLWDKIVAAFQAYLVPSALLERVLKLDRFKEDDLITIIFTSGSTGQPKGVMLTHRNVLSNVEAADQIIHLRRDDVLVGVLPFFHSFGFSITLWVVLGLHCNAAYHFSPLDARQVGKLCRENKATVLLATPTFLRNYLKRCDKEDFAALEVVVCGAEKLPTDLADAFEARFGVRPVEGYGITELAPLVSVNVPPGRAVGSDPLFKEGTVGRPVPGVSARVVHPETNEESSPDTPGMLLIKGPNVMQGYLNQPEQTAKVMRDGWYVTGDIAMIDGDGFIRITGRLSRFSKIGGEMVPHGRVEEEISRLVGGGDEDGLNVAVTALPDPRRGERLIVLYTRLPVPPEEIAKKLTAAGIPNLWIPSADSYVQVPQIPVLGTGKLDLRRMREVAEETVEGN